MDYQSLSMKTVAELRRLAKEFSVKIPAGTNKADIISLIRRATIGTPLKSHEERIRAAVSRLIDELRHHGKLTKPQENVLRKIEKYFLADENYVIGMQMFRDDSRFRRDGGQPRYDRIFDGHLAEVIDKLNNYLYDDYDDGGKSA